jgi:hypothetical protein
MESGAQNAAAAAPKVRSLLVKERKTDRLLAAAENGNFSECQVLIGREGISVMCRDPVRYSTPLMKAAGRW